MRFPRRRLLGLSAAGLGALAAGAAGCSGRTPAGTSGPSGGSTAASGGPGSASPSAGTPGTIVEGTLRSKKRNADVGWAIAYPPGTLPGDRLPVVVALHGYGANHTAFFGATGFGLDLDLAGLVRSGTPAYAIAAVDGGNTYWHPRVDGEDAGAMVVEEFLPLLAKRGLVTDRFGMYGFSMGGYGVLRLAGILGRDRVAAAVAVSPALWTRPGDSAPGAFDDAEDFTTQDVFGHQTELSGIPLRIDCGSEDGFATAVRAYLDGFAADDRPAGGFTPGGHDLTYWRSVAPDELSFLGERLG